MTEGGVIVERAVAVAVAASSPPLSAEAERAAQVMMRKSPQTLRTYQGIYTRFAVWLAARVGEAEPSVVSFTPEAFVAYLDERTDGLPVDGEEGARGVAQAGSLLASGAVDRCDGDPDGRDPDRHR